MKGANGLNFIDKGQDFFADKRQQWLPGPWPSSNPWGVTL